MKRSSSTGQSHLLRSRPTLTSRASAALLPSSIPTQVAAALLHSSASTHTRKTVAAAADGPAVSAEAGAADATMTSGSAR
jgi:hypothetical protein